MPTMTDIIALCDKIVREFNPDRVILFGSYARGTARDDSDVDIMVILPFEGKNFRKSLEIRQRTRPSFALDIVARKPEETARRYREFDPFVREVLDDGRVLYDRNGHVLNSVSY